MYKEQSVWRWYRGEQWKNITSGVQQFISRFFKPHGKVKKRAGQYVSGAGRTTHETKIHDKQWRSGGFIHQLLTGLKGFSTNFGLGFGVKAFCLSLILATTLPVNVANANASLVIRPTRIIILKDQPIASMTIENQGADSVAIQLQLMSWTQVNGEDVYTPVTNEEMMGCPPLFTIPAGQVQVVRVGGGIDNRNWDVEGTYRLFIQEIPPAPTEGVTAVQVAVRIGVPVFLPPNNATQPPLTWHVESRGKDGLWMTAKNNGLAHAMVSGVRLTNETGFSFETSTHHYILPGSTMSWRLDTTKPFTGSVPESVDLTVATDQGTYKEQLKIGK